MYKDIRIAPAFLFIFCNLFHVLGSAHTLLCLGREKHSSIPGEIINPYKAVAC